MTRGGAHPYCIVEAGVRPPSSTVGLEGGTVTSLGAGPLAVWVSELHRAPSPTVEALRRHDGVIRTAVEAGADPLPVRFGAWVADPDALMSRLTERREELQEAMKRVAGAEEFSVRFLPRSTLGDGVADEGSEEENERESPGRAYLRKLSARRLEEEERRNRCDELASALLELAGPLIRDERRQVEQGNGPGICSVAHLVPRERVRAYRDALNRFDEGHPAVRVVCTGPWAPYSFSP